VKAWHPPNYLPPVRVNGAMQTPDGAWRVEAISRGRHPAYRILHGHDVIDWLTIAGVYHILTDAGVDLTTLAEVDPHG